METFTTCSACEKPVANDARFCPFCGQMRFNDALEPSVARSLMGGRGVASALESLHESSPSRTSPISISVVRKIIKRYRDAYREAFVRLIFGNTIKLLGGGIGLLGVVVSDRATSVGFVTRETSLFIGVGASALVCLVFLICGSLICSQAQQLRATLDQAVYLSPYLDDHQRLSAMGIKSP